jgi:hypothetical protein
VLPEVQVPPRLLAHVVDVHPALPHSLHAGNGEPIT